ncbi:hypothetical protein GE21DRAFT_1097069 [Neurospora crassa]|nr:hypothetical protein GE21DRAFT_1097069 [Neurospora crassa]
MTNSRPSILHEMPKHCGNPTWRPLSRIGFYRVESRHTSAFFRRGMRTSHHYWPESSGMLGLELLFQHPSIGETGLGRTNCWPFIKRASKGARHSAQSPLRSPPSRSRLLAALGDGHVTPDKKQAQLMPMAASGTIPPQHHPRQRNLDKGGSMRVYPR